MYNISELVQMIQLQVKMRGKKRKPTQQIDEITAIESLISEQTKKYPCNANFDPPPLLTKNAPVSYPIEI